MVTLVADKPMQWPSTITGLDWTGGLTLKLIFMLPNKIHSPVGLHDALYKQSSLLAQNDFDTKSIILLATPMTILGNEAQVMHWIMSFKKLCSVVAHDPLEKKC